MVYEYIIIGAGASGLFAAASCRKKIEDGLILESTGSAGTKLLMSGNGQCNITHDGDIKSFVDAYGNNGRKIRSCLYKHNNQELIDFLENNGVRTVTREDGKIFPASFNSREILDLLLRLSKSNGFKIRYDSPVTSITRGTDCWVAVTPAGTFTCRKLIIASGGCSYHRTGSDGSMFNVLQESLGISIKLPKPALCALRVKNYPFTDLAGMSFTDATCSILHNDKTAAKETGGLLFTHKDFSGPAVINISKYAKTGDKLKISYCQGNNFDEVFSILKAGGKLSVFVPKRLEEYLREKYGNSPKELAKALTGEEFLITSPGDFNRAMATAGGIELNQLNLKTMEFKEFPGLYAIGEAVDIDGKTGGYNLQFAWSSARCAVE